MEKSDLLRQLGWSEELIAAMSKGSADITPVQHQPLETIEFGTVASSGLFWDPSSPQVSGTSLIS